MNYKKFERLLAAAFAEYLALEDGSKVGACERVLALLSRMLREQNGHKRKLAEIRSTERTKAHATVNDAERARNKLVRSANAASPQKPIKPVKTTKRNELRR